MHPKQPLVDLCNFLLLSSSTKLRASCPLGHIGDVFTCVLPEISAVNRGLAAPRTILLLRERRKKKKKENFYLFHQ